MSYDRHFEKICMGVKLHIRLYRVCIGIRSVGIILNMQSAKRKTNYNKNTVLYFYTSRGHNKICNRVVMGQNIKR